MSGTPLHMAKQRGAAAKPKKAKKKGERRLNLVLKTFQFDHIERAAEKKHLRAYEWVRQLALTAADEINGPLKYPDGELPPKN